jgi:hypothetical protein
MAFGPHGPRATDPPGTNAKIAWGVFIGLGVSFGLFAITRMFANPAPHTMTREWQEKSNEYLKASHTGTQSRQASTSNVFFTGATSRPLDRYLFRPRPPWHASVSPQGQLSLAKHLSQSFFCRRLGGAHLNCKIVSEQRHGGDGESFSLGVDTVPQRHNFSPFSLLNHVCHCGANYDYQTNKNACLESYHILRHMQYPNDTRVIILRFAQLLALTRMCGLM